MRGKEKTWGLAEEDDQMCSNGGSGSHAFCPPARTLDHQAGPSYVEAFLTVLKNVTKDETVQYVLAMLEAMIESKRFSSRSAPLRVIDPHARPTCQQVASATGAPSPSPAPPPAQPTRRAPPFSTPRPQPWPPAAPPTATPSSCASSPATTGSHRRRRRCC